MAWILIVAVGWMFLAVMVGLVVGRVIRNRDRQIPKNTERPSTQLPTQQQRGPEHKPSPRGH
ncbi:MAG: hypothetical protein H0X35_02495 [Pseudonocardiales bacterium]|nr:hypothetical protein [Pseudonocardiales bacterium]